MLKIALLDDYEGLGLVAADWSTLAGKVEIVPFRQPVFPEVAAEQLAGFDILCTMRERMTLTSNVLRALPKLKLIVTVGKDVASIDREAAAACGIAVQSTRFLASPEDMARIAPVTPEFSWGLMMSTVRHIAEAHTSMRNGLWQTLPGMSLAGRTLGLVGLGKIGGRMAHYARAFDMKGIAWSPHLTKARAEAAGVTAVTKAELFQQSDIISVHMVLSDATRGLVGAEDIMHMKSGAYLINTSRGGLIDETALITALRENRIAGAGLDVFQSEPLSPDHPLRRLPNVTLTPHMGYATQDILSMFYRGMPEVIAEFLQYSASV